MPAWPPGFARVPGDDWVERPPDTLALKYDAVQDHGWYRNLDPTVERLKGVLRNGDVLLDYSGGTGILAARLLDELPDTRFAILIVDASPKFLRVALDKLGADERVAFRLLRYLDGERRLQSLQEALEPVLVERGVDAISSTNAIFLPVRTLGHYLEALERAGFRVREVEHRPIEASAADWTAFLGTYHEGVLGWIGGSERIEGEPPSEAAVADRLELLHESVERVFAGPSFQAVWAYIEAD